MFMVSRKSGYLKRARIIVDWQKSPAAQIGQRFADIGCVSGRERRGFRGLCSRPAGALDRTAD
jgi:hypothetical protein